jgi:hypothetical protein
MNPTAFILSAVRTIMVMIAHYQLLPERNRAIESSFISIMIIELLSIIFPILNLKIVL